MKICLLGEFSGNLDEGMRKVSSHFAEELSKQHQILTSDMRNVFTKAFWKGIKTFNPEIIHYIHGPSIKSFILLNVISHYCRNAKTVMSSMRPYFSLLSAKFIPLVKPDLILIQSYETQKLFRGLNCKTKFLPCGVDVERFIPSKNKYELREKCGIDKDKFILFHVGSIKEGRNIQLLKKLQSNNNQVLIVGSDSTGVSPKVQRSLIESGCLVWLKYIKNIEEIYAMSDCYVYPTVSQYDFLGRSIADSIEMPLSVLEAMSCNLPVISTKFGALPRVFEEGGGLIFVDTEEEFIDALEKVKNANTNIKTRDKVLHYSWGNIVRRLERIYGELNENKS